jgi:single-stranded DNA-specific DHH superfamily exonuclease
MSITVDSSWTVRPSVIKFVNGKEALDKINKAHNIIIHGDVDMDGFMSTYIWYKWLVYKKRKKIKSILLNSGKRHGMTEWLKEYKWGWGKEDCDLLIILDSSSNELQHIRSNINSDTDILVVDHHEIEGEVEGIEGITLVNCRLNDITQMSCGSLSYELIRSFGEEEEAAMDMMFLYQCAAISLFTDNIEINNPQNKRMVYRTVHSTVIEPNLKEVMNQIDGRKSMLDKSFILYKLAPTFNKAIRASQGMLALNILLFNPREVGQLKKYAVVQDNIIAQVMEYLSKARVRNHNVMFNIVGVPYTYCGVIASKIVDELEVNTYVYVSVENEDEITYEGSFRGLHNGVPYRSKLKECGFWAMGHESAFGIKVNSNLGNILFQAMELEFPGIESGYRESDVVCKIGAFGGDDGEVVNEGLSEEVVHFLNRAEVSGAFVDGYFNDLGEYNSLVSSSEQRYIEVDMSGVDITREGEKYRKYDMYGLEVTGFKKVPMEGVRKVYVEESSSGLQFFLR